MFSGGQQGSVVAASEMTNSPPASLRNAAAVSLRSRSDQAAGLRHLVQNHRIRVLPFAGSECSPTPVLMLAATFAQSGARVLILTERAGNYGISVDGTLGDLVRGSVVFGAIAQEMTSGVHMCALGDGYSALGMSTLTAPTFYSALCGLCDEPDIVLVESIDVSAAPGQRRGDSVLFVQTALSGIASAYQQLKQLAAHSTQVHLIVDGIAKESDALRIYQRIARTAERFLGVVPRLVGCLPAQCNLSVASYADAFSHIAEATPDWRLAEYFSGNEGRKPSRMLPV